MKDLLQLIGFALLIILFFGSIVYPMSVERSFKEIYGKKGLSYGWAFVQLIGIFVCYAAYQDHDNRWKLFLGIIFCICTFVIAVKSLGKKLREYIADEENLSRRRREAFLIMSQYSKLGLETFEKSLNEDMFNKLHAEILLVFTDDAIKIWKDDPKTEELKKNQTEIDLSDGSKAILVKVL